MFSNEVIYMKVVVRKISGVAMSRENTRREKLKLEIAVVIYLIQNSFQQQQSTRQQ